jgi:hypothetical protein
MSSNGDFNRHMTVPTTNTGSSSCWHQQAMAPSANAAAAAAAAAQ